MKKLLRNVANLIPYVFLLIAFILIISVATAIKRGEVPQVFGRAIFLVVSPSMEDTIMTGDIIFVDTEPDTLIVGDIITFRQPGEENIIITHRIVAIDVVDDVSYYTTKGDNNFESLDWEVGFDENQIIGKYLSKSGFIGSIYQLVTRGGFNLIFIVIILVFVFIGVMEVFNIVKQLSMAKEKEMLEEKERLIQEELARLKKEQEEEE